MTSSISSSELDLRQIYSSYIAAIQPTGPPVDALDTFVSHDVIHNDRPLGLASYKTLIQDNIKTPGSQITLEKLLVDTAQMSVGARLIFTVPATTTSYLGFQLRQRDEEKGEVLQVIENVFYRFDETGKIERVWSVVDLDPVRVFVV